MCTGAAMSFFLGRVVYALHAPLDGASHVGTEWTPGTGSYRVPDVVGGICRDEAEALLHEYLATGPVGPVAAWAARTGALLGRADLDAGGQIP